MKRWQIAITLGIVCCILTMAICVQLKTIDNASTTTTLTLTSSDLKDQVLNMKGKYEKEVKELEKSEKKLEKIRLQAISNDADSEQKKEQIKQANVLLGLTDVQGSGITITLQDNNKVTPSTISPLQSIEEYLVHASDIIYLINDLKNAGAEAISVNGQRVVDSTAIYCAGTIIKINGEKISSPFEIKAIGQKELLYGSIRMPGGYLQLMEDEGIIVNVKKLDNIVIEKYSGIVNSSNMRAE